MREEVSLAKYGRRQLSFGRSTTGSDRPTNLFNDRREVQLVKPEDFATRTLMSIEQGTVKKRFMALIIAAYNEELVLEHTVRSAINAGMSACDIYIVDDASTDKTREIAQRLVGVFNVLTVNRRGKGGALTEIARDLRLTDRYQWIHIADADGEFDEQYFHELAENIDPKYVAATGYVSSLPGSYISKYRTFEYAIGMDIVRRFQSLAETITIIPGPTSVFRADVFDKVNFKTGALCEDFDVTLQLHRKKIGNIQFIPSAIVRTQDPGTLKDFIKQITRWNRGVMQMLVAHKVGRRASKVDAYLMYQVYQSLSFAFISFVVLPILTLITGNMMFIAVSMVTDIAVVFMSVLFAASRTGRWDIVESFPITYAMRWLQLGVFLKSFGEVILMRKFRTASRGWETVARRAQTTG